MRSNSIANLIARKRAAAAPVLDLTESNPTHAQIEYPTDEILQALADGRSVVYDPSPSGLPGARLAVADHCGVDPGRIVVTSSTSEAYVWLFKLLAGPGDAVLVPRPSYPLFEFLAALECVHAEPYPLVYHDEWFIDFGALRERITENTRAIVVVNPNNPTGSYLKIAELQQLAATCAERGLAIVSDEVFADYALADDARGLSTLQGVEDVLTFCLGGLSKSVGLPQMKLGWIIAGGPAPVRAQALEGLELIADTYLSVGTPVQYALPKLLGMRQRIQAQIMPRLRSNLEFLRGAVRHSACTLLNLEGGWYATLRVPRVKSEEQWVLDLLETRNVLVQPGYFYDFDSEAFLVLSLLTPPAIFEEGVGRLLALIQSGD